MKKYSIWMVLLTAATLVSFAAINWIVDPYCIYGAPEIKGFNLSKPSALENPRLVESINVLRKSPQVLIIGTSREDSGVDPKHPVFLGRSVFNAAMPSQPFVESKEILRQLSEHSNFPKEIVYGLLFENANVFGYPLPVDYSEDNFKASRPYELLISLTTLRATAKTFAKNLAGDPTGYVNDGFRASEQWTDQLLIGQRKSFKENEKQYLFDSHFPLPACKSALLAEASAGKVLTPMEEVRDAVAIAYRMKSDMHLFIGPSHARQWETIQASGLWKQFEDWKRMLVNIVESEAVKANATPFQVWDFSGYNSITEEDVPSATDINKRMHYYYESSHYTPAAGDLVLDHIFHYKSPSRIVPDDFGVLLSSKNIEAHLANIRTARERYRKTHPDDVAEIAALAAEVAKIKRCHRL